MNKKVLLNQLVLELEALYQVALTAAKRAHSTATDKENIAENKYDTLGLESAYLAQGQAKRASECRAELEAVQKLTAVDYSPNDLVSIGALVKLTDENDQHRFLFLASVAGGLKFNFEGTNVVVITPSSPLGKVLIGKCVDDEFEFTAGLHKKSYLVSAVY